MLLGVQGMGSATMGNANCGYVTAVTHLTLIGIAGSYIYSIITRFSVFFKHHFSSTISLSWIFRCPGQFTPDFGHPG